MKKRIHYFCKRILILALGLATAFELFTLGVDARLEDFEEEPTDTSSGIQIESTPNNPDLDDVTEESTNKSSGLQVESTPNNPNLDNVAEEYPIDYTFGGTLKVTETVLNLKFDSGVEQIGGSLVTYTIVTVKFDANPYEIRYWKGESDDITVLPRLDPGYPANTEVLYDHDTTLRTYYEDDTERLGRSYTIRFDSNDVNDGNGSTQATLVTLKDNNGTDPITGWKKQFVSYDNRKVEILGIETENRGFDGTLMFSKWKILNNLYDSGAHITAPNFTTEFGGVVDAVAQWKDRTYKLGYDFTEVTRTGYDFIGWKSMAQGIVVKTTSPNITVKPSITMYEDVLVAQWRPMKFRLILDYNYPDGTEQYGLRIVQFDKTIREGNPSGELPVPSLPGYTFLGWFTGKYGGDPVDIDVPWTYNRGGVIYAHWSSSGPIVPDDPKLDDSIAGGYDYLIPESQIVRVAELDRNDFDDIILANHYWTWDYKVTCPGHVSNGETYYCTAVQSAGVKILNTALNNYPYTVANKARWSDYNYILEDFKSYSGNDVVVDLTPDVGDLQEENANNDLLVKSGSIKTRHNYNIAFHRGLDGITVVQQKNDKDRLNELSNIRLAYVPTTRLKDAPYYKENISINFKGNADSALFRTTSVGEEVCPGGLAGTVTVKSGDFSKDLVLAYKTYRGLDGNNPNGTSENFNTKDTTASKLTFGTTNTHEYSGERVLSGFYTNTDDTGTFNKAEFSFYPYIKMRYDTLDGAGRITTDNEVYVYGDKLRTITLNDYVEIIYKKSQAYEQRDGNSATTLEDEAFGYSLKLDSSQWLMDASTADLAVKSGAQIIDNENVIPGGATLTLSTSLDIREYLTLKTYQCALSDEGLAQVQTSTGTTVKNPSFNSMKAAHENFVNSVLYGIDHAEITQWQYYNSDIEEVKKVAKQWAEGDFSTSGTKVFAGADLSSLNISKGRAATGATASTDPKYYFRSILRGEAGATKENRSDLDSRWYKLGVQEVSYNVYTFSTDTSGNLWVSVNNGAKKLVLTKTQNESALTGVYKEINDRTYVISKLRDALEFNTGYDPDAPWAADGKWYNEAFDGVSVWIFESTIETGLIDSNNRTQVFDPKLITSNSAGISSSYNTFAVNQFRTSVYAYDSTTTNLVGKYKANNVYMMGLERLYISKPFYNSNTTVTDKH